MTDINVDLEAIIESVTGDPVTDLKRTIYVYDAIICMTAAIRADRLERTTLIKAELQGLKNRLQCYHDGTHGRSTVKMHVELKKIEQIQTLLDEME